MRRAGRGGDTMLAHITPDEAEILKMLGGAGTINSKTGLPEFYTDAEVWQAIALILAGSRSLYEKAQIIDEAASRLNVSRGQIASVSGLDIDYILKNPAQYSSTQPIYLNPFAPTSGSTGGTSGTPTGQAPTSGTPTSGTPTSRTPTSGAPTSLSAANTGGPQSYTDAEVWDAISIILAGPESLYEKAQIIDDAAKRLNVSRTQIQRVSGRDIDFILANPELYSKRPTYSNPFAPTSSSTGGTSGTPTGQAPTSGTSTGGAPTRSTPTATSQISQQQFNDVFPTKPAELTDNQIKYVINSFYQKHSPSVS